MGPMKKRTKILNKPIFSHNNLEEKTKYHIFEFRCGDLYLRENVNSNKDILSCYPIIKKYFNNIKKTKIDKFRWNMVYTYPVKKEENHLNIDTNFAQILLPISYNGDLGIKDNILHIPIVLLNEDVEPLIKFIKSLNNLKKIQFNDCYWDEYTEDFREYLTNGKYIFDYLRTTLKNPNFLNPESSRKKDYYDPFNFKVDKKILHKLKKLRKSLGKQVAFLFNHIDYYPVTIQEILKKNGIIKKTTSWSY